MAKTAPLTKHSYSTLRNMPLSELIALRVQLAKRSNQRLVRLERSESIVSGDAYRAGAYDLAIAYLKTSKDQIGGKYRFSESKNYTKHISETTGKTAYDLYRIKRDILEMERFLSSKSSTVSGNREIERKRIETFEANGISEEVATDDEFYDFLNSNAYEYFTLNQFTSEEIVDIYNTFREAGLNAQKIQQAFDELKELDREKLAASDGKEGVTWKDIYDRLKSGSSQEIQEELQKMARERGGTLL